MADASAINVPTSSEVIALLYGTDTHKPTFSGALSQSQACVIVSEIIITSDQFLVEVDVSEVDLLCVFS